MKVTLPYPPAKLSPNKRLHWAALAKAKSEYRTWCHYAAVSAVTSSDGIFRPIPTARPLPVAITFHPPDKRRRDLDNAVAALKAGQDAVASVIRVDDALWWPSYRFGDPIKGGCVIIQIGETA